MNAHRVLRKPLDLAVIQWPHAERIQLIRLYRIAGGSPEGITSFAPHKTAKRRWQRRLRLPRHATATLPARPPRSTRNHGSSNELDMI